MQFGVISIISILDLLTGIAGRHLTDVSNPCDDVHVWIAGGAVDCKYLYQTSFNGLHRRPAYYCTKYAFTECCHTCTRLGFGPGATTTESTAPTTPGDVISPGDVIPKQGNYSVISGNTSVKSQIEVELPVRQFPGISTTTARPTTAVANKHRVPEGMQKSTDMKFKENSNCTDEGVWMLSGRVSCTFLLEPSFWGLHLQQTYYCHRYPLTSCCRTCALIDEQQKTIVVKQV